jgi:hypothetical protein
MHYRWTGSLVVLMLGMWGSIIAGPGVVAGQHTVVVDFSTAREPVPPGWELSVKTGEPQLQLVQDDGKPALRMRSEQASFSLQKKVQIALQKSPFLVWEWKATELPRGGDFRKSSTDDQAAQLIVAFSSSQFITYIWDTTAPKGTMASAPAPLFKKIFAIVMESGPQELSKWITERRNLIDDFKQTFGEEPETIEGIRIQINTQHTESRGESYWRSIVVTAKP